MAVTRCNPSVFLGSRFDRITNWQELDRARREGKSIGNVFGYEIPPGITYVEDRMDYNTLEIEIGWLTKDGKPHTMRVDADHLDHENIVPVIVAMRLSVANIGAECSS